MLLAKQKWRQYSSVASAYSDAASRSASSVGSQASTAIYGDQLHQASKSASSIVAQATNNIAKEADDTKDFIYST